MTEPEKANRLEVSGGVQPEKKKPYVKPEFRHEQVFETMAVSCGKTSGEGQCHSSRSTS